VGSDLLGPAGRILGLAEQRFREEARRVRLESELADARRLEAIGRLAGGVAHDFNNVLTVIIGNTELALHGLPPATPAEERLREVLEASRRAAALVAQLLALGSRKPVNPGPVDLGAVVHGLEDILRRLLGEGCRLSIEVADSLPPCRAETTQVEQVLLNLVANARDAMPTGGTTTITVDRVTSPPDAPTLDGDFVALAVHDTGVGMDDETRRRAFEPFFSSKPFGAGTGLGLATVHGILSQSGGGASIESAPGHGTTFRAYLPVYVPEPVALVS
jgi:signal transduction histidine kinase